MTQIIQILRNKEAYIKWMICKFRINRDKAEEYISRVILKLLERDDLPVNISHSYVRVSLRNSVIDDRRSRDRHQVIYLGDIFNDYDLEEGDVCEISKFQGVSSYKDIRSAIYRLKDNYKRYLILKFGFKLTCRTISEFLEVPLGTVNPVLSRAQRKLKQEVSKSMVI